MTVFRDILVFLIAIIVLVGFHEFGHFITAKLCGVKVLRFSLGFGPVLFRKTGKDGCEFAVSLIPLGGYVKMLDTREMEVKDYEMSREFNSQPVWKRLAIVAAGPVFNIVLAFFLFYGMFLLGVQSLRPYVTNVKPDYPAYVSGMRENDLILKVGDTDIIDWEDASYTLIQYIGEKSVPLKVKRSDGSVANIDLNIEGWSVDRSRPDFLEPLGFMPKSYDIYPVVGYLVDDAPAMKAGIKSMDRILSVNGIHVDTWFDFTSYAEKNAGTPITFEIHRAQIPTDVDYNNKNFVLSVIEDKYPYESLTITVVPEKNDKGEYKFGIGAYAISDRNADYRFTRHYGIFEAIPKSLAKMYSVCKLTVVTIVKFIDGNIPVNNISGPIAIAQTAGLSLSIGLAYFLSFLGIISINLGIMNLLPVPVLDGGHIMFYFYEMITGKKVSDVVMTRLVYVGMGLLLLLMVFAVFNDLYYS